MIEATCIEFYNIVANRTNAENDMRNRQNEGWKIVSVFAWTMGTMGVVYNREQAVMTIANTFERVIQPQAKHRGRPAKVK